ncbi:hypothetical protein M758_4G179500 [Ceratodon purpureus]|nr:hypothetical protein M758_4G179500 [Ceratodon purpureus]
MAWNFSLGLNCCAKPQLCSVNKLALKMSCLHIFIVLTNVRDFPGCIFWCFLVASPVYI